MQRTGKEPAVAEFPIRDVLYIQQVLDKSGIMGEFTRMKIDLYRKVESGEHRFDIHYDRAKKQIVPAFDYQVRPGDRIVVTQDNSTVLDDMLGTLPLPF